MKTERPNLAALADGRKKPSKTVAQSLIKELAGPRLNEAERLDALADLYAFFNPPKVKKPKTDWDWVALAMAGSNDSRDYLQYVYVTETHVTATDGHRLHRVANTHGLAPGFYNRQGDKVYEPDWRRYPDVERVIPSESRQTLADHVCVEWPAVTEMGTGIRYYPLPHGGAVQQAYLDEAMAGSRDPFTYRVRSDEKADRASVRIDYDGRLAVVMPIKV